jgi:predicted dehydrogenase/threonine dehydrogenase-like Zn-dependent dehydrogenase
MKQVVQNYRTGEMRVDEVPTPLVRGGGLLVATAVSAVSAGTEKSKVDLARASLVGKALARPDQVRKVIDTVRREGLRSTYNKVRGKLDSLTPLGYSAAGRVVAVGDGCEGYVVGDRVACAGAGFANHAELIWVPANLCARVPAGVEMEAAAFTTIGAIALQGIRQAEAAFGETIVVIGLGLIGLLTVQLLKASGCRVIGIDVDPWKVELARSHGADDALVRTDDVIGSTRLLTDGRGADAIIITAAASTNDPIVLAGELARERAHVVIVGALPLEVPRSPFYEKELDLRLSRSYGPGRYDRTYEEKGLDYPAGYVRWTENRNMQAFLQALASKQVVLDKLVTHRVRLSDAVRAYDLVTGEIQERFLGVVLTYDERAPEPSGYQQAPAVARTRGTLNIGFIGAGSFAAGTLLPILKERPNTALAKVCTASGLSARDIADRHGFRQAVGDPQDIFDDEEIDVVFIASRHESHADLACKALARGKAVFVEKPLALDRNQLEAVRTASLRNPSLIVGFNRRFSPHTEHVRRAFGARASGLVINIRVNAGPIPDDSWIHDPSVGGGRLIGEGCHFVDLAHALGGANARRVYAAALGLPDPDSRHRDNVAVTLELTNGNVATIVYTSKGDPSQGKERIEVFGGGMSAVIEDFHTTTVWRRGKVDRFKTKPDKGHLAEIDRFLTHVASGRGAPFRLEDIFASSLVTIAAAESLGVGAAVDL